MASSLQLDLGPVFVAQPATRDPHRDADARGFERRVEFLPCCARVSQHGPCPGRIVLCQADRSRRSQRERAKQRRGLKRLRDAGELVCRRARTGDIARGEQDLHRGREQARPNDAIVGLAEAALDRSVRDVKTALHQSQLC